LALVALKAAKAQVLARFDPSSERASSCARRHTGAALPDVHIDQYVERQGGLRGRGRQLGNVFFAVCDYRDFACARKVDEPADLEGSADWRSYQERRKTVCGQGLGFRKLRAAQAYCPAIHLQ